MTQIVMMMTSLQIKRLSRDFYNDIDEDCNPEKYFDLDGDGVDSYLFGDGFDCDDSNLGSTYVEMSHHRH